MAYTRGVRGAITVKENNSWEILSATQELMEKIVAKNKIEKEQVASVFFSMTADLNAIFPAEAARKLGWTDVPLFCSKEIEVPDSLPYCIRILMLVNMERSSLQIQHIYLRDACKLRPDLSSNNT